MSPKQILNKMEELFPDAQSELINWGTPFQFLVCILLSAQTTDKGVNSVTKSLFKKYPDSKSFAMAKIEEVERFIKSVNYYRTKAKHIIKAAQIIEQEFSGVVPSTVEDLIKLPGVGYKTANVYLNDLYKKNEGIAVDTHVARVAKRLGLTKHTDPNKIAKDLEKLYLKEDWWKINRYFVLYGRYICRAKMKKSDCVFKGICTYCTGL
ncbi:MAG TPA: endonuclease III [Candidatus Dojkabacteria bacterium]|nr:endonuclease III [Candidatus Dojkabacteria bacterium]